MARKKDDGKYKIKPRPPKEQIEKTRRRATLPKIVAKQVKTTPLVQYMIDNEKSGKTTLEMVAEFRETCGHDYREIAYLPSGDGKRITFQVCQTCGSFATNQKKKKG